MKRHERANLIFNLYYGYDCPRPWTESDNAYDSENTIRQLSRSIMSDREGNAEFKKKFKTVRRFRNWFDKQYPPDNKYPNKV